MGFQELYPLINSALHSQDSTKQMWSSSKCKKKKRNTLSVLLAYVPVLQSYISRNNCSHYMLCPEEEKQLEGPSSSWQVTMTEFQMDLKN